MRASELGHEKLVIFDIDDTLVNTDTKVGVVRDGKIVKKLNSHDFTHYKLQPGETFDFGEFQNAREFFAKARPIPGMIRQLKQDIATGNRVIMLTARSDFDDRDTFLNTFRRFGIDMSRVHVYRAGNLAIKAATEEKKKIVLRQLLGKEHFDKLIMYDDSVPNLDAFLSLKQEYPWSRFYAWHVDSEGQATEYHRAVDETVVKEWIVGNEQVGNYRVAIDSHLIQRQNRPGHEPVPTEVILQTIYKLPQARGKFKRLNNGQQFWLHDNSNNISVGFQINDLENKRFTAKTVWPGRTNPGHIPAFEVR